MLSDLGLNLFEHGGRFEHVAIGQSRLGLFSEMIQTT